MRALLLSLVFLAGCATTREPPAAPTAAPSPTEDPKLAAGKSFRALVDAEWEWQLEQDPVAATFTGDTRYDDRLPDESREAIEARRAHARELLAKVQAIDPASLPEQEQLNYALFRYDTELDVERQRFPTELQPISQLGGVHTMLPELAQANPPRTSEAVGKFVARLDAFPALIDQSIALLREGVQKGVTPPQVTLVNVADMIRAQIPGDVRQSPTFAAAFRQLPAGTDAAAWKREQDGVAAALEKSVYPAYRKLLAFWTDEYFPRARKTIALSDAPDGKAWYASNVKRSTTTRLTPQEIHAIGLSEVKRIRAEMEQVRARSGFQGTLAEYFTFLRTDPRFFFKTREELVAAYRDLAKRIDPRLPRLFGKLPRLTYGVEPVPGYAEKTAPTAYYQPGSPSAGRAGTYFANTYDLKSRPRWEMEPLTSHEAVPGHHLQIALAQELTDLPRFRQEGGYNAYVEGWGLYAESLGKELGLYQDPASEMGRLTYEMWRAIRLVVDTGLHDQGWTRERAISYFLENAPKPRHDAEVEVDRYIVIPGQALGYKLGELEIQKLRKQAEAELGPRFDVRRFHDAVLAEGALPLELLDAQIEKWLAKEKARDVAAR